MAASGVPLLASCFFAISTAFGESVMAALAGAAFSTDGSVVEVMADGAMVVFSGCIVRLGRSLLGGLHPLLAGRRRLHRFSRCLLVPEVLDGALDGVFGENGAVHFDGRQIELFDNERVLDTARLVDRLALDPLSG